MTATLGVAAVAGILASAGMGLGSELVLTGYVVLMAARSGRKILHALRARTFGVDVIAVTAVIAAVLVGELWAALIIVLMLTTGEALEEYAATRARRDLTAVIARAPRVAHRFRVDGVVEDVPVGVLAPGDRILVRAGEVVPVDGSLSDEAGSFDESSVTGESMPVDKTAGDDICSGVVNGPAAAVLIVVRAAADSQYQQIVALVTSAAQSRAPIVRLADKVAVPFAAVTYCLAGAAWAVSGDVGRFAEVLVVATPCPLIIAAPVAFMAGMSRAAREGIIIRDSSTLEALRRVRAFAFDKTGTLTRGEPALVSARPVEGIDARDLVLWAASAESNSLHILAAATVRGARNEGMTLLASDDAVEVTGQGVVATVAGRRVVVGKRTFIGDQLGEEIAPSPLTSGETAIYVAVDGRFAGTVVFRDEVRANAPGTLAALRARGIERITMLTGDDRATAEHVAAALGITDVAASCLPFDKVHRVAASPVHPIAMVGDGVNDAPVLAAAEVGMAMGARGASAASEAADVVILRDDLSRVVSAVDIGRRAVGVALQAIALGLTLSLGLMVAAAFGLLPAIVGAWLQEGIDVAAILWALRAATAGRPAIRTVASLIADGSTVGRREDVSPAAG
ncbi:heavy metal translocating P-type ATPase [Microbacterium oleivorans]|uniref:heavy metal translocating P-type ATPase n=1 Tax=Microbacterium oleivorans TaxID=273677 RepID=UPI001FCF0EA2|nr:heavy metal translocating P-type ATPase [Microbacterium oleivorans]